MGRELADGQNNLSGLRPQGLNFLCELSNARFVADLVLGDSGIVTASIRWLRAQVLAVVKGFLNREALADQFI